MDLELMGPDDHSQAVLTRRSLWQQPHVSSAGRQRRADVSPASAVAGDAGAMQNEGGSGVRKKRLTPCLLQQAAIERMSGNRDNRNSCSVLVLRIQEKIAGMRHKRRGHFQQCRGITIQPLVSNRLGG